jgi:hypothetical protein
VPDCQIRVARYTSGSAAADFVIPHFGIGENNELPTSLAAHFNFRFLDCLRTESGSMARRGLETDRFARNTDSCFDEQWE